MGFAGATSSDAKGTARTAVLVFVAYLLGAEVAFLVGTLSDRIFAPLWPPNIVLLTALLLQPRSRAWLCIAAAFPAHVIAEVGMGMPISRVLLAFAANVGMALAGVQVIHRLLGDPPWLGTIRKAATYILMLGFFCPAVIAVGGAFARVSVRGWSDYPEFWLHWLGANALGNLTLGAVAVIFAGQGIEAFWPRRRWQQAEIVSLLLVLILLAELALQASASRSTEYFIPVLLYAPIPIIVWCAIRFGVSGASVGALTVTVVVISHTLDGASPFGGGSPESNVFALQVFLVSLAVPVLLLGASIDQARRAEDRLSEDEEQIALVAVAVSVGFWRQTGDSLWLSEHGRRLLGIPMFGEVSRDSILALVHPDDVQLARRVLSGSGGETDGRSVEVRIVVRRDEQRWVLLRSRSQPGVGGEGLDVSGIIIDITPRKAAEAEVEKQRRDLAHLMRVAQASELSSGLAHELTQPLTAILANAQAARFMLASKGLESSSVLEVIDDIIDQDQRAGEVIKRLRALLRKSDVAVEEIDVNEVCESTLALLRAEAIARCVTLVSMPAPHLPKIVGDPVQLQQVLLNLVMNAVEAVQSVRPSRRAIVIRSRRVGETGIEVSVEDKGPGIGAGDRAKVFEPFFTTKERGLGIGLSICSAIIGRHGGTLVLENNPIGGATAYMRLPVRSGGGHPP
ncbi:MASE1 domain-containing protein [Microbacteriaceae bacterium K1510]|nr:MASE1 domain-containing protein [Microbacteriaceae bacterium K1510]